MSTRKTPAIRRAQPAKSAREANGRWGLSGVAAGGSAASGSLAAYTAEQFDADVKANVIELAPSGCPRRRPECDCWPGDVPQAYRSKWTLRALVAPDPAPAEPRPEPMMMDVMAGEICYDCRMWLYWRDRQRFYEEHGDHGLGYVRPSFAIRQAWAKAAIEQGDNAAAAIEAGHEGDDYSITGYGEMVKAAKILFRVERSALHELAGEPESRITHRYEQAVLLGHVRRLLTKYLNARAAA